MVLHDVLRSLRKLLAELLGKLGGVPEVEVVDVDVLRDDGFYPAADPVGSA